MPLGIHPQIKLRVREKERERKNERRCEIDKENFAMAWE